MPSFTSLTEVLCVALQLWEHNMKDILLVALAGNFLLINIDLIKRRASGLDRNCNWKFRRSAEVEQCILISSWRIQCQPIGNNKAWAEAHQWYQLNSSKAPQLQPPHGQVHVATVSSHHPTWWIGINSVVLNDVPMLTPPPDLLEFNNNNEKGWQYQWRHNKGSQVWEEGLI